MRIHKTRICVECSKEYAPVGSKQKACEPCWPTYRKRRHAEQARNRNRLRKQMAIEYKGGKCSSCNKIYPDAVFEFHHLDPREKDLNPCHAMQRSWKNLKKELDKCIMLCANCHRILHHDF